MNLTFSAPGRGERGESGVADRRTLLFVDDGAVNRLPIKYLLEAGGRYRVDLVEEGRPGLAALGSGQRFDGVLIDLDMTRSDGFAVAAAIRGRTDVSPRLPIIAVTVLGEVCDRVRARAAGMSGHVPKVLAASGLARAVDAGIEQAERGGPLWCGASCIGFHPVWDGATCHDLAGRIGHAPVAGAMVLLADRLRAAAAQLSPGPLLGERLAREAHDIISCSGMLGFTELCEVAKAAQMLGAPWEGDAIPSLVSAARDEFLEAATAALGEMATGEAGDYARGAGAPIDRPAPHVSPRPPHAARRAMGRRGPGR